MQHILLIPGVFVTMHHRHEIILVDLINALNNTYISDASFSTCEIDVSCMNLLINF